MFEDARKFIADYRTARRRQLANETVARWFCSDKSVKDLTTDTFGSNKENDEWDKARQQPGTTQGKLRALRSKINYLVGCRHDIREQFAVGAAVEPRTIVDFDRFTYEQLAAHNYASLLQKQALEMEEGIV